MVAYRQLKKLLDIGGSLYVRVRVKVTVRRGRVIYRDTGCVSGVCSTVTIYSGSVDLAKECALLGVVLMLQITLLCGPPP